MYSYKEFSKSTTHVLCWLKTNGVRDNAPITQDSLAEHFLYHSVADLILPRLSRTWSSSWIPEKNHHKILLQYETLNATYLTITSLYFKSMIL